MTKLNKIQSDMLTRIAEGTLDQTVGYAMVKNGATSAMLAEAGLIELNAQMVDGDKIAARTTEKGLDAYQNGDNVEPANEATTNEGNNTMSQFEIETAPLPARKRGSNAKSIYPFDALEVGQRFFVPATEEMPNPGKSLASTVSSASKRYATENGTRTINRRNKETGELEPVEVKAYTYSRKFSVVAGEKDGVKGAFVGRIPVEEAAAE